MENKKRCGLVMAGFRLSLFIFFIGIHLANAQTQITGSVTNTQGLAVDHATVMLKNNRGYVLSFTNTNATGKYSLNLPDTAYNASLTIEVNLLGYKKARQQINQVQNTYNFLLEEAAIDIKGVEIKKQKLTSTRDTLSYDVAAFSRPEDRSIGDVIRRLPGVAVADNGQIYYNGNPIADLYIHGDDLMDGRYGLATKVITKEMIKSIEVLQHFQPIKVLKDRILSDAVAMNLVLKDENSLKFAGQGIAGGGLPRQFDMAANSLLLNKSFKMINSLQANNSGVDYKTSFERLGNSGFVKNIENSDPIDLLSSANAGFPDLPKENYYLNKSGLINANNLVNLKSGLQIKTNIQGFIDRNKVYFKNHVQNFLSNDTISYSELQNAVNRPSELNTAISVMANKDRYFLNNRFSFNISGANNKSYMDFNNNDFNQALHEHTLNFTNDLSYIPALKNKDVLDFRWYLSYFKKNQTLDIDKGLNPEILNNNFPFASINQFAEIPTFFSHANAAYHIERGIVQQSYAVSVDNERQSLNSALNLTQSNGGITNYTGDVGNELSWNRDRITLQAEYFIKKEAWQINVTIPLIAQTIRYDQDAYTLNVSKKQLFVAPLVNFMLYTNSEDYLSAKYRYNNNTGTISDVYRGAILTNYRSVFASSADLQEQHATETSLYYNFQRSTKLLFINAGINYKRTTANSILSTILTENIQRTVVLPYENEWSSLSANIGFSKFLFGLNTTVALKSSWNSSRFNQFINNEKLPFTNSGFGLNARIEFALFKNATFNYTGDALWSTSKPIGGQNDAELKNKTKHFNQNISLNYKANTRFSMGTKARHIYAVQSAEPAINYLFVDAQARYKLLKWRTELEFNLTNIANIKSYEVISLSSNQLVNSRYDIRGRMGILKATFTF